MDFSQIKTGRPDTITLITDEIIESIPKVRLFEGGKQANQANERLYQLNKQLLSIAKNKNHSYEVGCIWDLIHDKVSTPVYGNQTGVSFISNSECRAFLKSSIKNSKVVIHNHPRNGLFSSLDLQSFSRYESVYAMLAICNDGLIYTMYKRPDFNSVALLNYYNSIEESGLYSKMKQLSKHASKLGIVYRASVRRR